MARGAGGERFDVFNPATEEVLASVASAEVPMPMPRSMRRRPPSPTGPRASRASAPKCCARPSN
jgi:hypothetical protein